MEFLQIENVDLVMTVKSSHDYQAFFYLFYFSLFGHIMSLGKFSLFI